MLTPLLNTHSAPQPAGARNQIFVRGATGGLGIGFVKPDAPPGHPYVVTELAPGGPAAISGAVQPGDTILSVDGKPITQLDPAHVRELIVGAAGSSVVLGLGAPASIPVAPPAAPPAPAPAPPNLFNVALNRAETGGIGLGFNRSKRFMQFLCRCVLHSALVDACRRRIYHPCACVASSPSQAQRR